jgi:L-asparaginase
MRLPSIPEHAALPVHVVTAVLDADRAAVDRLLDPAPAGLVVAATGGGNTVPWLLEAGSRLIDRGVPVALTTRCPSGRALPGYGFPGGSSGWWDAGAIFSGTLDPLKARVLLALGRGAGLTAGEIAAVYSAWGGGAHSVAAAE